MAKTPIYEKDLSNLLYGFDTIGLSEYEYSGVTYSGMSLVLNFAEFSAHFNTTGHSYSNVYLNNDVYTYTGLTGEIHYFIIRNFYSGATISIDPLLTGFTASEIISGFTIDIISCTDILYYSGSCCPIQATLSELPWVCITNTGAGVDNCEDYLHRRVHKGWSLDYIFNRSGQTWTDSVFFYTGVRDEYDPESYGDNNLSFKFTSDGRIRWSSYRYSGYCNTTSGYTPIYYISTGQTMPLCPNGTSADFNLSIVFDRYYEYSGCSLANEGGWNDLINTGYTSTTGSTIITGETIERLSQHWLKERKKRLGTLKIYHNGHPVQIEVPLSPIHNFRNLPVYEVKDFEEIILSDRGFQPFTHLQGGGTTGSGGIHDGVCCYLIKYAAYFEEPLQFVEVHERYNTMRESYSIVECWDPCEDSIDSMTPIPNNFDATPNSESQIYLSWHV